MDSWYWVSGRECVEGKIFELVLLAGNVGLCGV